MKRSIIFIISAVLVLSYAYPQQKEIVEEVSVEWWVVPIFAVDKTGQPVLDLVESDIELKVGSKTIKGYTLVKKSFNVSQQPFEPGLEAPKTPPVPEPKKNVFLLFDTALSTKACTEASKAIAQEIIARSEQDTRFFVMTIEPFAGLTYAGGQTTDKAQLFEIIDKKVKGKNNSRVPNPEEVIVQMGGKGESKYDADDMPFLQASVSKYYKRKSKSFAQSFESLYYALNAIKDNKFIYLFSEGISSAIQDSDKGDRSMYQQYLRDMADYLGRSGSVLFIINPFAGAEANLSDASGTDSLKLLAETSGGKYLEGNDEELIQKIENMHQAYYEVFFPAAPTSKSEILKISLLPKRRDIEIHTLQTTEKTRDYSRMKAVEQEVLALNLISGNPLYKTGVTGEKPVIDKVTQKKNTVTYQVVIPERFLHRALDLYKIWKPKQEAQQALLRVERESLKTDKPKIKITFKNVKPDEETYFALIAGEQKIALVHGMKGEAEETAAFSLPQEPEEWTSREVMAKEKQGETPADTVALEQMLTGVANYCEKLKQAAFHYICKEKIYEDQQPLRGGRALQGDIGTVDDENFTRATTGWERREEIITEKILSHSFNYRLLKMGEQVKEERDIIIQAIEEEPQGKSKKQEPPPQNTGEALKGLRFVSSKAVFGPITLLAADRQVKYNFRLLGYEQLQDRRTAVIEALPKDEQDSLFIYGKIWIDPQDFSVLKIKANPNSVLGYERLRKFADRLSTRLLLTLETEFFNFRDGIRFPTRINFEELYKGGPFVSRSSGSKGWTRTKTITSYDEYMFFDVKTDVTYK